jgi:hypothetical protein
MHKLEGNREMDLRETGREDVCRTEMAPDMVQCYVSVIMVMKCGGPVQADKDVNCSKCTMGLVSKLKGYYKNSKGCLWCPYPIAMVIHFLKYWKSTQL